MVDSQLASPCHIVLNEFEAQKPGRYSGPSNRQPLSACVEPYLAPALVPFVPDSTKRI